MRATKAIAPRARQSIVVTILTLCLLGGMACHSSSNSAQGVAESFVDQHYVMIDLKAAKQFSTGLAQHKIEKEQSLTDGHTIDESTLKPTVHYRLLEKRDNGGQPSFLFEGTIYSDGSEMFTRKWLITVRQDQAAWKVSNFEEFE